MNTQHPQLPDTPAAQGAEAVDPTPVLAYQSEHAAEMTGVLYYENHDHRNPYYIVSDGGGIGAWYKRTQFEFVEGC